MNKKEISQKLEEEIRKISSKTLKSVNMQECLEHPEYLNAFSSEGPVMFSVFNHQIFRFSYISPNVKDILGISPEELIAIDYQEFLKRFIHPEDLQLIASELFPEIVNFIKKHPKKKVTRISIHYNYRIKTVAGNWIKIAQQTTPLEVDEKGDVILDQSFYTQIGKADCKETLALKLQVFLKDVNGLFNLQLCRTYLPKKAGLNSLTPREIQILKMLAHGLTSYEMANALNISETTIITHRRNMLRKLYLKNASELISWGYEKGIL